MTWNRGGGGWTHDLCPGQGAWKGGKNVAFQDINILAFATCAGHALTIEGTLPTGEFQRGHI